MSNIKSEPFLKCKELKMSERTIQDRTCEGDKGPCSCNGNIPRGMVYDAEDNVLPENRLSHEIFEGIRKAVFMLEKLILGSG
jgi:hypothetical protein